MTSETTKRALDHAARFAYHSHQESVRTDHFLIGLLHDTSEGSLGALVESRGLTTEAFTRDVFLKQREIKPYDIPTPEDLRYSPRLKELLERIDREASSNDRSEPNWDDIIAAFRVDSRSLGYLYLQRAGLFDQDSL